MAFQMGGVDAGNNTSFSPGYSLAVMLGINMNSSPPSPPPFLLQGGKQASSDSVVSKRFCVL